MDNGASRAVKPLGQEAVIDAQSILNALSHAVVVVDDQDRIVEANMAAEQFFQCSRAVLRSQPLRDHIAADSPLFSLLFQVRTHGAGLTEAEVNLDGPRIGSRLVSLDVATIPEAERHIVLAIRERGIASKIDRQMTHRGAARSATAMAAMLAHEVKNPLSGIRGAAQLLEQSAMPEDQLLTRLIVDESDRICALVDRMEIFTDRQPLQYAPVNIHRVLEHVRRIAQNGFARNVRFVERYDPSLPLVCGHRDRLIQIFLNLVKNAAEAAPGEGGEIILTSAYRHGARLAVSGCDQRIHLPLIVSVQDNGDGIAQDLRPYLFNPFMTTKANGSGLGLALVAKIVHEHGGIIEFDSERRCTVFRVHLPMYRAMYRGAAEE